MERAPPLTAGSLREAFGRLDRLLPFPVLLVVGGGTAMLLAYRLPVRTTDVDAYPVGATMDELAPFVREVARELQLAADWINPYYETFAHVLPGDYATRLVTVFEGGRLLVRALGLEDLLVMKCFAGREKDVGHARALLKRGPDLAIVERRIEELVERGVAGAADAADFLDDVRG